MKVAKWGNSLAVRIPSDLVQSLGLREGDEIELKASEGSTLKVARKPSLDELFEEVNKLRGRMPDDFKFDRDEANDR